MIPLSASYLNRYLYIDMLYLSVHAALALSEAFVRCCKARCADKGVVQIADAPLSR